MQSIVTLTMNPAIDESSSVGRVIADHKLRCRAPRYEPGGGGLNVSRAIRRLRGTSLAVYPAGGPTGQRLRELLARAEIDQRPVPIADWTRENLVVLDEATNQQYRFCMPGPTLKEAEWRQCLEVLEGISPRPSYLVASGSLPPGVPTDLYALLGRLAREWGSRLVVDASGEALRCAAREGAYLLKPSLRELGQLVGREIRTEAEQEAVTKALVHEGKVKVVVLSLGAEGALLTSAEGCERFRAPGVPVRSQVGAGDSMVAGIVHGLAHGASLRDAVRFGVAAGTAAVLSPGTELCHLDDVKWLLEQGH